LPPTEDFALLGTKTFAQTERLNTARHINSADRIQPTEGVKPSYLFSPTDSFSRTEWVRATKLFSPTGSWQTERLAASGPFSASVVWRSDRLQPTNFPLTGLERRSGGALPTANGINESILSISFEGAASVVVVASTHWFCGSPTFLVLTEQFLGSESAKNSLLLSPLDSDARLYPSGVFMRSVDFINGTAPSTSELSHGDSGTSGVLSSWLIGVIVGALVLLVAVGVVLFMFRQRVVYYTTIEVSTEEELNDHISSFSQKDEQQYVTQETGMSSDAVEQALSVADDDDEFVQE
jgi:hypothetical protein